MFMVSHAISSFIHSVVFFFTSEEKLVAIPGYTSFRWVATIGFPLISFFTGSSSSSSSSSRKRQAVLKWGVNTE